MILPCSITLNQQNLVRGAELGAGLGDGFAPPIRCRGLRGTGPWRRPPFPPKPNRIGSVQDRPIPRPAPQPQPTQDSSPPRPSSWRPALPQRSRGGLPPLYPPTHHTPSRTPTLCPCGGCRPSSSSLPRAASPGPPPVPLRARGGRPGMGLGGARGLGCRARAGGGWRLGLVGWWVVRRGWCVDKLGLWCRCSCVFGARD